MEKAVDRLYVNSCNSGNLIFYQNSEKKMNVASAFSEIIGEDGVVYGWDGNTLFGPRLWEFWKEDNYEARLASPWSQKVYRQTARKYYGKGGTEPQGLVKYYNGKRQEYFPDTSIGSPY